MRASPYSTCDVSGASSSRATGAVTRVHTWWARTTRQAASPERLLKDERDRPSAAVINQNPYSQAMTSDYTPNASLVNLPVPIGRQRQVVALRPQGHFVVLGTAGSGKTTMAVHRAAHLSNPATDEFGRTLLLTFNKALLAYFDHLGASQLPNVDVRNYHRFARGYLNSVGRMGPFGCIVNDEWERASMVREAVLQVRRKQGIAGALGRDDDFFITELRYMAQHGFLERGVYLAADRVGRGLGLDPNARERVFDVQDAYRALRGERKYWYDWEDIASAVHAELLVDDRPRQYRHIVVDEGQDFSPEMLRSLALAIPPDGSLTFFGDVAQQIYGRGISWRSAGLNIATPWQFEHNYRNTPEIARLGLAIAAMPYFRDQPDMVAPTGFRASGPPPTLVRPRDQAAETAFVIQQARAASATGSVGVLVTRHEEEPRFQRAFADGQRIAGDLAQWAGGPGISYGTVHAAKGFEFDTVILVGLTSDRWPEPQAVAADGLEEATAVGGRLLYVGVTRARQNLIMTATGELTELLPTDNGLWTETTL
jgi:AAA domain/UvrD-like helicase C-terminal domain